jgi:hypothetical protein
MRDLGNLRPLDERMHSLRQSPSGKRVPRHGVRHPPGAGFGRLGQMAQRGPDNQTGPPIAYDRLGLILNRIRDDSAGRSRILRKTSRRCLGKAGRDVRQVRLRLAMVGVIRDPLKYFQSRCIAPIYAIQTITRQSQKGVVSCRAKKVSTTLP